MVGVLVFAAAVGFVNLPEAVSLHPLSGVLAQYDREITALRNTRVLAGLRNPALSTARAAAQLQVQAASAAAESAAIGTRNAAPGRARERAAIAEIIRSHGAANGQLAASTAQLIGETDTNLRAYSSAMARRSARAVAAREQEFAEKETTLTYDLERRDAERRLLLQLKLSDLHLDAVRRAELDRELAAMNAREAAVVAAQRRADAGQLQAYRHQVEQAAASGTSAMESQLRTKAQANYTLMQQVFNERADTPAYPSPSQLVAFTNAYAAPAGGASIAAAMRSGAAELAAQFTRLGDTDSQSAREVATQLALLQRQRAALYRSMVTEIQDTARAVARRHRLAGVSLVTRRPNTGGVDLTPAVVSCVNQAWRTRSF